MARASQAHATATMGTSTPSTPPDRATGPPARALGASALLEAAIASAPDGFVVFDGDGACVYANAAATELLGRSREEIGARPYGAWPLTTLDGLEVAPGELPTERARSSDEAEGHYAVAGRDGRAARDDDRVAVRVHASAIRDGEGRRTGVLATIRRLDGADGFRRFVETFPEFACVIRKGRVVHANHAALALAGYASPDEVVGHDIEEFMPAEDRATMLERVRRAEDEGRPSWPREERLIGRSRFTPILEVVSVPCTFDGQPSVVVLGRDVTAHRRNDARRERRAWELDLQCRVLDAIIAHAPVALALVRGPELVLELVNPTMQGFAPGIPMLGRPWAEVSPELPEVASRAQRVLRTGNPERIVDWPLQVQRAAGGPLEPAWFTVTLVPMRSEEGAVEAVLGLAIETTEEVKLRRLLEQTARAAQQQVGRIRAILDAIPDALFVADPEGRVALANHAAARLVRGAIPSTVEALGERLRVRAPDGARIEPAELPLSRALAGEPVELFDEIVFDAGSGTDRRMRVNALAIRNGDRAVLGAVEVVRDVTEISELDRIQQQFVQLAAHELNTPLTALKGNLQVLRREPLSERQAPAVAAIARSVERMVRLVEDLVYITELEIGDVGLVEQTVDLAALLETVAASYAPYAAKHPIDVRTPGRVALRGDREGLRYVIASLVDNAIRFSPAGGPIVATLEERGEEIVLTVTDRGVGIPAAAQRRVFQKFYRAHAGTRHDYGGLGVSLHISRAIVERHGGRVELDSVEGDGTTIRVLLPRRP